MTKGNIKYTTKCGVEVEYSEKAERDVFMYHGIDLRSELDAMTDAELKEFLST